MMNEIVQRFELQASRLLGTPQIRQARSEALSEFQSRGFPSRKDERWHYTDIRVLGQRPFELAPPEPQPRILAQARALLARQSVGEFGSRAVFVDGHLVPELSSLGSQQGVEISDLSAEPEAMLQAARAGKSSPHALAALNSAFTRSGLVIRVSSQAAQPAPIHIVFIGSGENLAPQIRILIDLAANARADILQHFVDLDEAASGWINAVTQVRQDPDSVLKLYRLQEHSTEQAHTALLQAKLGSNAQLIAAGVELGGGIVRQDIDIELASEGASTELFGLSMAGENQHIDNHLCIDHKAALTNSSQTFRAIAAANGRAVFNGKVIVQKGAQKIDARQKSDNLLLSDEAEIDTKPELEIYADDVKCSHGATVGELDEDHLFYLRARGIDEETARGLLSFAFANTLLQQIELPALRERAAVRLAGQLPESIDLDEALT